MDDENQAIEEADNENEENEVASVAADEPDLPIVEAVPDVNEEEILRRIYLGDLEDLPSLTSKIVRIFTSSTFTGTFLLLRNCSTLKPIES